MDVPEWKTGSQRTLADSKDITLAKQLLITANTEFNELKLDCPRFRARYSINIVGLNFREAQLNRLKFDSCHECGDDVTQLISLALTVTSALATARREIEKARKTCEHFKESMFVDNLSEFVETESNLFEISISKVIEQDSNLGERLVASLAAARGTDDLELPQLSLN